MVCTLDTQTGETTEYNTLISRLFFGALLVVFCLISFYTGQILCDCGADEATQRDVEASVKASNTYKTLEVRLDETLRKLDINDGDCTDVGRLHDLQKHTGGS